MTLNVQDAATFQKRLTGLPVMECPCGENVLTAGSTTGRLFVLRSGSVEILKDGVQIAEISEPGAVFGEMAVLNPESGGRSARHCELCGFLVCLF